MMKWYENVDMLKEILENISKELEEVEYGYRVWYLLTDENNLIKNHLELIKENQELKKVIKNAIELLSIDGKGTKQQVIKLLKEVLENES